MTDSEKAQLAQKFIHDQLKACPGPILIPDWGPTSVDGTREGYRLTLWVAGRTSGYTFSFSRDELVADYASKAWEQHLRGRVRDIATQVNGASDR